MLIKKISIIFIFIVSILLTLLYSYNRFNNPIITTIDLETKASFDIEPIQGDNYHLLMGANREIGVLKSQEKKLLILNDNFNLQRTIDLSLINQTILKSFWFEDNKILFQHIRLDFDSEELLSDNKFTVFDIENQKIVLEQEMPSDESIFYINDKFYILKGEENPFLFYEFDPNDFKKKEIKSNINIDTSKKCDIRKLPTESLENIICILKSEYKPIFQKNIIYNVETNTNSLNADYKKYKDLKFTKDLRSNIEKSSNYNSIYQYDGKLLVLSKKDYKLEIIQIKPVYSNFNYHYFSL